MRLHTHIAGIPCLVELEYHAPLSGSFDQPPEAEGFTIVKIMDRRGREAAWLEAKLSEDDIQDIVDQAFTLLRGGRREHE